MILYSPIGSQQSSETLDELALKHGNDIKKILVDGAKDDGGTHAYVNYANGGETAEEWYGKEPWRLERLRNLKKVYDPQNRFRYYAPIVPLEDAAEGHSEL